MICVKCQEEKPETGFYRRGQRTLRRDCKACHRAAAKVREQADPAAHAAKVRAYRRKHPGCTRAKPEAEKRAHRRYQLKRRYGLTPEAFEAMVSEQAGACAICRRPFLKTPAVDHCHKTGAIRGILCHVCNLSIGAMETSERLLEAAAYLERFECRAG